MNMQAYEDIIHCRLSTSRYKHSIGVATTARELAYIYKEDPDKAYIAGLFHDYAKEMKPEELEKLARKHELYSDPIEFTYPRCLHGPVGAYLLARRELINDEYILDAIRWHTTGKKIMSVLTSIIYIADYIEPNRLNNDNRYTVRKAAYAGEDLSDVVNLRRFYTVNSLIDNGAQFIHPLSMQLYHEYLKSWK